MDTMKPITSDNFKAMLPVKMRKAVNQDLIDQVNTTLGSEESMEIFRENLLSYTHVMREGKFKITSYISAVRYVSFKLLGCTNHDAYIKTFPDKYARFLAEGVAAKDIASYSTAYNKSKLVNLIYEQTLIPTHVLNAHMFQQALNVQAELMMYATSEKVRCDAANSVMTQLKPPEIKKFELDIGVKEDSAISALRDSTMALVSQQRKMVESGMQTAADVAGSILISAHPEDHPDVIDVVK